MSSKNNPTNTRICACCFEPLPRSQYDNKQWALGKGLSLCGDCARNSPTISSSSRHNISDKAKFEGKDLNKPFASGSFRWVAKGRYTSGPRKGDPCVVKWFKEGGVLQKHYFASDIAASEMATRLIEQWNREQFLPGNKLVRINLPQVWTSSKPPYVKVLAEPFIEKYRKFNSNTGWADTKTDWACVMQAISHYSFHVSKGNLLLCDLQGGVFRDGAVLTDPVVMSYTREYGPTDLGRRGIQNFFANHQCNQYCRDYWLKPRERKNFHKASACTLMVTPPACSSTASSVRSMVSVQYKRNNVVLQKEVPMMIATTTNQQAPPPNRKPGLLRRMASSSSRLRSGRQQQPSRAPLREVVVHPPAPTPNKKKKTKGPLGRPVVRRPEVVLVQI
mmetsp:Transcript_20175/g.43555  ORF Transcript_20175/g.43555 Transcript_20175/m.43555 type:complete len:390 (+) Transcript_20175:205-1374(+)|eukprot:CAMPEP_0168745454 /NCGR_PEP_ID=MMETSP0724-20121128/14625_1 /TAXON_ID=265536 /ORGANISM="Amphiprora sp., Strain CCMP467" /LENGTH=389 /DNA_ID=CAMNT_0008793165 /DNA_START=205 /DNA_END=1374 /DNA_ORIENTATION=-